MDFIVVDVELMIYTYRKTTQAPFICVVIISPLNYIAITAVLDLVAMVHAVKVAMS